MRMINHAHSCYYAQVRGAIANRDRVLVTQDGRDGRHMQRVQA
jgi:hypothetical protein